MQMKGEKFSIEAREEQASPIHRWNWIEFIKCLVTHFLPSIKARISFTYVKECV